MTTPCKVFGISAPHGLGKTLEFEFWRMQEEKKDAKHANMKWTTVSETVTWPVDIGLGKTVSVNVVAATSTKAIKCDHEIRVFTPQTWEKKRNQLEVSMNQFGNETEKRQKS